MPMDCRFYVDLSADAGLVDPRMCSTDRTIVAFEVFF
jgi:hypothetical protein